MDMIFTGMAVAQNITNATGKELYMQTGISIWARFLQLVTAPYNHQDMLWITLPLIAGLFLMQFYFGIYRKEELGWNTAVGNSLALIFVSMDLFRQIYTNSVSKAVWDLVFNNFREALIVFFIGFVSIWLLFGEFFHFLPKKVAFLVSSSLPTTLVAYLGIILIYTKIPLDIYTFFASLLLFILLAILFRFIHFLEPISMKEED